MPDDRAALTAPLKEAAPQDFPTFMSLVHETDMRDLWEGKALPAAHHMAMMAALVNDENGHTLLELPRGAAKTLILQAFIEWKLGRASMGLDNFDKKRWVNDFRVVWFSNTAHQAYRVSNAIKATIESNEFYQAIFPKVKPHKDKWSQEEWKVKGNTVKDATFFATGVGGPALGARAVLMVFDDIGDQDNMTSPSEREKLLGSEDGDGRGWIDQTAMPILVPWGRFVMAGTRWAWWDANAWARKQGCHIVAFKALTKDDDGWHSYWPERFPVKWLLNEKDRAAQAFARQYQNEVAPDEGITFQRDWFPRFDYLPGDVAFVCCSWDTAFGQGRNRSWSAGWSVAVTPDWHYYLFRLQRGQVPYPVLRQQIVTQAIDDKASVLIVEQRQSGQAFVQEWALSPYKDRITLIPFDPSSEQAGTDRRVINARATTACISGRVHLPSEYYCRRAGADWLPQAELEIFSYPAGAGIDDDVVDAMCQMIIVLDRRRAQGLLRPKRLSLSWADAPERKVMV